MNDGFLLAECAFYFLAEREFIIYKEWKHETRELYYTVSFYLNRPEASTVSFEVTVSGGQHRITKSIIRMLERRYNENFDGVFTRCAI
jgi:hypothetical protein